MQTIQTRTIAILTNEDDGSLSGFRDLHELICIRCISSNSILLTCQVASHMVPIARTVISATLFCWRFSITGKAAFMLYVHRIIKLPGNNEFNTSSGQSHWSLKIQSQTTFTSKYALRHLHASIYVNFEHATCLYPCYEHLVGIPLLNNIQDSIIHRNHALTRIHKLDGHSFVFEKWVS